MRVMTLTASVVTVDVGEVVDTRLGVVSLHRRLCRRPHPEVPAVEATSPGVEYIERQSVVGLVAGAVVTGIPFGEAKFGGNLGGDSALDGDM